MEEGGLGASDHSTITVDHLSCDVLRVAVSGRKGKVFKYLSLSISISKNLCYGCLMLDLAQTIL